MAEGLGFEPSHNGFRDRRATTTLALNMFVFVCPKCQASFRFAKKVEELANRSFMVGIEGFEPSLEGF